MSGMSRLAALKAKVRKSKERTTTVHEEQVEKRAVVAAKKAAVMGPPKKKEIRLTSQPAPKEKPINSIDVEGWFRVGVRGLYGDSFIISPWTVKQRSLAKKLLTVYGPDLTRDAVEMFCSGWRSLVKNSRGRISGAPNVSLLWGMRERIYADVQNKGKEKSMDPMNRDEFQEESSSPKIGW